MIDAFGEQRLLSVARSDGRVAGYRFAGPLHALLEQLDRSLVRLLTRTVDTCEHSCTTLVDRELLDRIGFFDKLPSIPFHATPHLSADGAVDRLLLSPSTCYSTFAHLEGVDEQWPLQGFTARGRCHRAEPASQQPTRMAAFEMREFVFVGDPDEVVRQCEETFGQAVDFLRAIGGDVAVERASDVFYGERPEVTRKVQRTLGVKAEAMLPWSDGTPVAVASRNLHRQLFTAAFSIGPQRPEPAMHSACVAFGLERLLLTLLSGPAAADPARLQRRIEAADAMLGPGG